MGQGYFEQVYLAGPSRGRVVQRDGPTEEAGQSEMTWYKLTEPNEGNGKGLRFNLEDILELEGQRNMCWHEALRRRLIAT